jgi:hypothetical protein
VFQIGTVLDWEISMLWETALMNTEEAVIYWWIRTGILYRYRRVLTRRLTEAVAAGSFRKADTIIRGARESITRTAADAS